MKTIEKKIMRRVYYLFGIRIVTHPMVMQGLLLVVALTWLAQLVFFARIWQSFVATPVGELGAFFVKVVTHADGLTLLVTLATTIIMVALVRSMIRFEPIELPEVSTS